MLIVILFVVAIVGLVTYALIAQQKRRKAVSLWAQKRRWTALPNDVTTLEQYLPRYITAINQNNVDPTMITIGKARDKKVYDMAYLGSVANHELVLFQYTYTLFINDNAELSQPDRAVTYYFTVLNVSLQTRRSLMMLLHHGFLSKLQHYGLHDGLQPLSLEGDFNQRYDMFIAPNTQVEALSLFTPDIMEGVIGLGGQKSDASLQIDSNGLICSFENQLLTPEFVDGIITQLEPLLAKIDRKPQPNQITSNITTV